eukprot:gene17910-36590_t
MSVTDGNPMLKAFDNNTAERALALGLYVSISGIVTFKAAEDLRFQRGLRLVAGLGLAAVLAACSSGVKLDDVPVEDRAGSALNSGFFFQAEGGILDPRGVSGVSVGG